MSSNGSDVDDCCQYGKCLCSSLDKALNCSGNRKEVTIFIYSDMISLSTTVDISNVNNFTLASDGATIICNRGGGVVFTSIGSLVFNRITWNSCGNSPGVISVYSSLLVIKDNNFKNSVTRAVAVYCSSVFIDSDVKLSLFSGNKGGALYISNSSLTLNGHFNFIDNAAISGAAIYFTNQSTLSLENGTKILFLTNEAAMYGGAIYTDLTIPCSGQHTFIYQAGNSSVTFTSNIAGTAGRSWYFELNTSCNFTRNISDPNSLLYYPSSFEYTDSKFSREISTTLYQLKLLSPANCIKDTMNSDSNCNEYEISNIMLGQEILIPAQALGYYGNIARPTQVLINCSTNDCINKALAGNNIVLVHNNTVVRGIKILRSQNNVSNGNNITLQLTAIGKETVSINLTIKLSPCFPGFENVSVGSHIQCRCYQHKDVKCVNDSTAMIKFGYWFGEVEGEPSISYCPKQYCEFTSCDATNFGYCKLPCTQDDQCRQDRTGPVCSKCKPGYVLPFDSAKCVKINQCSPEITFGVVSLCVVFWFVIIVMIIAASNYFTFPVGFTGGIIYFYSVIDYLLGDIDDWPVFQFVTILSNLARLNPKFFGTLCVTSNTGWSGIDQQFFHYVHPLAIVCVLQTSVCFAKYSVRFARYIARFIIRFICFTPFLLHTSLSSTSIELLAQLTFSGTKASSYTYSSPDLKYFHGRHAFYGTVAGFLMVFVICFPIFLILEPLLSRRMNFIRIKPLTDQWEGCYRDSRKCFAGFYLLCRLGIIGVFYVVQDTDTRSFSMLILCTGIAIIHGCFMPYKLHYLNMFDMVILILATFATCFKVAILFASFNSTNKGILIGLVITPLIIIFFVIVVFNVRPIIRRCKEFQVSPGVRIRWSIKSKKTTLLLPIDDTVESDDNSSDDNILDMSWRYVIM